MRWMIAAPLLLLFHGCDAKIAFLFISRGSLPLSSVWERFFAPVPPEAYTILVHTPPGVSINSASPIFMGRELAPQFRVDVSWGRNVYLAEAKLLEASLIECSACTYFFVHSEHCMPIRTFSFIDTYVSGLQRTMLQSWATTHRWRAEFNVPESEWREGSAWAGLTRDHAKILATDVHLLPALRFLTETQGEGNNWFLDEHWKQTVLVNDTSLVTTSPTWASWPQNKSTAAHPDTLCTVDDTDADLPAETVRLTADEAWRLFRFIQSTVPFDRIPRLFARKMCPSLATLLFGFVQALDGDESYKLSDETPPLDAKW